MDFKVELAVGNSLGNSVWIHNISLREVVNGPGKVVREFPASDSKDDKGKWNKLAVVIVSLSMEIKHIHKML